MTGHIKSYGRNLKGRDFFTTDVHGHYDLLHEKLREVAFDNTKDRLFSGGDWCDRGPDSKHVLDYLCEPWIYSVQANHETMVIQAFEDELKGNAALMLYTNGGQWFFDLTHSEQQMIVDVFKSLPLAIEIDNKIGIVHAEVPYGSWGKFKAMTDAELRWNGEATAQWARTKYDRQDKTDVAGIATVLVGHTPTKSGEVEQLGNVHYCDLGSFFRDKISFLELKY